MMINKTDESTDGFSFSLEKDAQQCASFLPNWFFYECLCGIIRNTIDNGWFVVEFMLCLEET